MIGTARSPASGEESSTTASEGEGRTNKNALHKSDSQIGLVGVFARRNPLSLWSLGVKYEDERGEVI